MLSAPPKGRAFPLQVKFICACLAVAEAKAGHSRNPQRISTNRKPQFENRKLADGGEQEYEDDEHYLRYTVTIGAYWRMHGLTQI